MSQINQNNIKYLTPEEVLHILRTERTCVSRASSKFPCSRQCDRCDLLLDADDIINAYSWAIGYIDQGTRGMRGYRKI